MKENPIHKEICAHDSLNGTRANENSEPEHNLSLIQENLKPICWPNRLSLLKKEINYEF